MGIISRGHSPDRKRTGTTVIAAGTKLVGDLALSDNLHVDGRIEGSIESEGEVSIGEQGQVEGEIKAAKVLVSGRFNGDIDAERLEIVASGEVSGTVLVGQLVIESGARFNGTSKIRGQEPPRQLSHDKGGDKNSGKNERKTEKAQA
ncbi:MAG: polymer-forming cytoskeletal protein [Wenzhouxiangella sp.]|nr:polymer-forming cytoskeletal protein [Wenzhouxiangella sp.]MCH8476846.1 polymer-forming cytoskeletal protein [Wenzhouxiangella sp.]TVR97315.1 MAG: polymer-forming cytoskeletal protein [Wenzhouxiangellaceae bacterium]